MSSSSSKKCFWIDLFVCSFGPLLLAAQLIMDSPKRYFWGDESLTLVMVKDLTFWQMIDTLKDTINAYPPTYFCLIWLWAKVFGISFFALRAFSSVCLAGLWILLWLMLRSFVSRLPAALGIVPGLLLMPIVRVMNADARAYSLYCLAYVGAGYFLMSCLRPGRRPHLGGAVGTFLAYALLVTTHYVGIVYAGVLLGVALAMWFFWRSPSLGRYCVAGLAGASMALFDVPFYLTQRNLGGEGSWLGRPSFRHLDQIVTVATSPPYIAPALLFVVVVILCVNSLIMGMVKSVERGATWPEPEAGDDAILSRFFPLAPLLLVSILVPSLIWFESRFGIRLFLDRYLAPSLVTIWPIVVGFSLDRAFSLTWRNAAAVNGKAGLLLRALPWFIGIPFILGGLAGWMWPMHVESSLRTATRLAKILENRPVDFVTTGNDSASMRYYCGEHGGQVKYLMLDGREQTSVAVVSRAIDRRFWKDFVITQGVFARPNSRWLIRESELIIWQQQPGYSIALRIIEKLGDDLIVVEVDDPPKS